MQAVTKSILGKCLVCGSSACMISLSLSAVLRSPALFIKPLLSQISGLIRSFLPILIFARNSHERNTDLLVNNSNEIKFIGIVFPALPLHVRTYKIRARLSSQNGFQNNWQMKKCLLRTFSRKRTDRQPVASGYLPPKYSSCSCHTTACDPSLYG